MGRKLGSKDKRKRAKRLSPYEAYKKHYTRLTKGDKKYWFKDMYTEEQFNKEYEKVRKMNINARKMGLETQANPALAVAQSQRHVDRGFEKKYYELTGNKITKDMIMTAASRRQLFLDFVGDRMLNDGKSFDEARDEFEEYIY